MSRSTLRHSFKNTLFRLPYLEIFMSRTDTILSTFDVSFHQEDKVCAENMHISANIGPKICIGSTYFELKVCHCDKG